MKFICQCLSHWNIHTHTHTRRHDCESIQNILDSDLLKEELARSFLPPHCAHISLHMSTQCSFMCWEYINMSSWFFLTHPWVSDQRSSFMPSIFEFLQLESFLLLCFICDSVLPSGKLSFNCLFLCHPSEHISSKLSRMCSTYLY